MLRIRKLFFISDLLTHHNLLKKLVFRDFFEKFAGSALGFFWAILNPLVLMGMYILLFSLILKVRFDTGSTHADFGFILFCAMIPWLSFQDSITRSCGIILCYRHLIHQVKIPLSFLPLHIAISTMIQEIITLFLFISLSWYWNETSSHLWVFFLVLPLKFFFTTGFNLLLSSITVYFRDLSQILQLILILWFFATPIVYPLSKIPEEFLSIYQINPMLHLVSLYRYAILGLPCEFWNSIKILFLWCIPVYLLGFFIFAKNKDRFSLLL